MESFYYNTLDQSSIAIQEDLHYMHGLTDKFLLDKMYILSMLTLMVPLTGPKTNAH